MAAISKKREVDRDFQRQRDHELEKLEIANEQEQYRVAKTEEFSRVEVATGMTLREIERGEHDDKPLDVLVDRFDRAIARARARNRVSVVLELVQEREKLIQRRTGPMVVASITSMMATVEQAAKEGHVNLTLTTRQAFDLAAELHGAYATHAAVKEGMLVVPPGLEQAARDPVAAAQYVVHELAELFGVRLEVAS